MRLVNSLAPGAGRGPRGRRRAARLAGGDGRADAAGRGDLRLDRGPQAGRARPATRSWPRCTRPRGGSGASGPVAAGAAGVVRRRACRSSAGRWSPATSRSWSRAPSPTRWTAAAPPRRPALHLARAHPAAPAARPTSARSPRCAGCTPSCSAAGRSTRPSRRRAEDAGLHAGRDVRRQRDRRAAASTTATRSTAWRWRSATDGRIRIGGPDPLRGLRGRPGADRAARSSTGGTSPPTPAASTRTAGCRCSAASTTWSSAAGSTCRCRPSPRGCASTPRSRPPRCWACRTRSGGTGWWPSWSAPWCSRRSATGSARRTRARGRRGRWSPLDALPLLDNGKVDRQALVARAGGDAA